MLSSLVFLGFVALASAAQPVPRQCYNATVPVTISARTANFNLDVPKTNRDVSQFVLNSTRQGANFTDQALTGYKTTSGTYNISTKFCMPTNSSFKKPIVQVLTHGIGFDKTYWDLRINNYNYSYVNSALAAGYCTLSYDRLGIGNSSHGDTINEIQASLEIAAMRALTDKLRNGSFPNANQSFGNNIVHVGHSFGSVQTYAFGAMYPNETSGLVLTGFSLNGSFGGLFTMGNNFQIANRNQPLRFGNADMVAVETYINSSPFQELLAPLNLNYLTPSYNYSDGYIVNSDQAATETLFFHPGNFDPALLVSAEASKQPVTYGELLTLGSAPATSPFTGPVLVFTGQYDIPFCGGDCYATGGALPNVPHGVQMAFKSNNFASYIQPNTAHSLNVHYNATAGFQVIQNFLGSHGLKSS